MLIMLIICFTQHHVLLHTTSSPVPYNITQHVLLAHKHTTHTNPHSCTLNKAHTGKRCGHHPVQICAHVSVPAVPRCTHSYAAHQIQPGVGGAPYRNVHGWQTSSNALCSNHFVLAVWWYSFCVGCCWCGCCAGVHVSYTQWCVFASHIYT